VQNATIALSVPTGCDFTMRKRLKEQVMAALPHLPADRHVNKIVFCPLLVFVIAKVSYSLCCLDLLHIYPLSCLMGYYGVEMAQNYWQWFFKPYFGHLCFCSTFSNTVFVFKFSDLTSLDDVMQSL
jgi:hypothetical protein